MAEAAMKARVPERVSLGKIMIDGGTQPRAEINEMLVAEYAAAMSEGAKFPPVIVFFDGSNYWLADGFHRFHAALQNKQPKLLAEVRHGLKRDAVLYSVGANATNGQRRTNEDKRRAVLTLLNDAEWGKWSNSELARRCAVSHPFVIALRSSLVTVTSDATKDTPITYRTKHGTVTTMDTENIGKRRAPAPALPVAPFSDAKVFGEMALSQLSRIRHDDPGRGEMLREVIAWCEAELKAGG